jgi:hypothetical protein
MQLWGDEKNHSSCQKTFGKEPFEGPRYHAGTYLQWIAILGVRGGIWAVGLECCSVAHS